MKQAVKISSLLKTDERAEAVKSFESSRGELLHAACQSVHDAARSGAQVTKALKAVARSYRGKAIGGGRYLRLALPTMTRNYYLWVSNPCPAVFNRPNRPARKAVDRSKLLLAIEASLSGPATAREVFRFYCKLDENFSGGYETLRRALGSKVIQCLAEIRRLRKVVRSTKRRELSAIRAHECARDRLEAERKKMGVPPRTINLIVNGIPCTCTPTCELLTIGTSNGSRPTHQQRKMIHELFHNVSELRKGRESAK